MACSQDGFFDRFGGKYVAEVLRRPLDELEGHVRRVLAENEGSPGHIFNLGHGVPPDTPVENLRFVVDCVHRLGTGTIHPQGQGMCP